MSVNKVILVGRLTAEPESRSFPSGGSVCSLRLATNRTWKDKNSGLRKEAAEYHRVTLGNKLGEIAQQYLHKGSQIYIEGRIQTRKWQDQSGQDRHSTEIIGNEMRMLDSRSNEQAPPPQESGQNARQQRDSQFSAPSPRPANPPAGGEYPDDDIPFSLHQKGMVI